MSEQTQTPVLPPEEQEQEQNQTGFAERFQAFRESASERAESLIGQTVHASKVAYYGLAAAVTHARMERAGTRMERMHHKAKLYSDLGMLAMTGKRGNGGRGELEVDGSVVAPRSIFEKIADTYIDKKAQKKGLANTYAYRAEKIFGPKDELPGLNDFERRVKKGQIKRNKSLTAQEKRLAVGKVDAAPLKLGEKMVTRTQASSQAATREFDLTLRGVNPYKYKKKRDKSIDKIITLHKQAEAHRDKAAQLREARQNTNEDTEL